MKSAGNLLRLRWYVLINFWIASFIFFSLWKMQNESPVDPNYIGNSSFRDTCWFIEICEKMNYYKATKTCQFLWGLILVLHVEKMHPFNGKDCSFSPYLYLFFLESFPLPQICTLLALHNDIQTLNQLMNSVHGWNNPGSSWSCLRHFITKYRINTQKPFHSSDILKEKKVKNPRKQIVIWWSRCWKCTKDNLLFISICSALSPTQQPQLFYASLTFFSGRSTLDLGKASYIGHTAHIPWLKVHARDSHVL